MKGKILHAVNWDKRERYMGKKWGIYILFALLGVFIFASELVFHSEEGETFSKSPNIMVDNVVYWLARTSTGDTLSEDFILIGETKASDSEIASTNLHAFGVAEGAKVYQSKEKPGWVYVQWDKYYNLFTVWELNCPLLRYNDKLYVSIKYIGDFEDQFDFEDKLHQFNGEFELKGALKFGEYNTVPKTNMEVNHSLYDKAKLFYQNDYSPVVYVLFDDPNGNTIEECFCDVELVPIDYGPYLNGE